MRRFVDLSDMPLNPEIDSHSISSGKVLVKCIMFGKENIEMDYSPKAKAIPGVVQVYPYCIKHGAMNKNAEAGIWRCVECHEGCWEITD